MQLSHLGLSMPSPVAVLTVAGEGESIHQEVFYWLMPCSENRLAVIMAEDSTLLRYLEDGAETVGINRLPFSSQQGLQRLATEGDRFSFSVRDDEPLIIQSAAEAVLCTPEYTLRPDEYSHYTVMFRITQIFHNTTSNTPLLLFPQGKISECSMSRGGLK